MHKYLNCLIFWSGLCMQWYLIKHEAYKVNLAGSLFFAGVLIGNVLFGSLSDKIGRKPVFLTSKMELNWFLYNNL